MTERDAETMEKTREVQSRTQECAAQMLISTLDAEAQKDVMNSGAYLLVSESAVNILEPLTQMRRLATQLKEVLT
jgi:hypothetical protein